MQILGTEKKEYETYYNTSWQIDVSNKDVIKGIRVEDRLEYFVDAMGNKYSTSNMFDTYSHYISTKIDKHNFEQILGADGYINIYNSNGQFVALINNTTPLDSEDCYIIAYPEKTSQIIIETSAPVGEGTLYINNTRAIEPDIAYTKDQMRSFVGMETRNKHNANTRK